MVEAHVVGALREKRAEVSGLIADLEKRIAQHRADLVHVDAVLRLYLPALEPASIAPRAVRQRNGWFKPGELARTVLDILRVAPAPLPIRAIAVQVMERRGLDPQDERTAHLIRKLINNVVTRQGADLMERVENAGSVAWRIRA